METLAVLEGRGVGPTLRASLGTVGTPSVGVQLPQMTIPQRTCANSPQNQPQLRLQQWAVSGEVPVSMFIPMLRCHLASGVDPLFSSTGHNSTPVSLLGGAQTPLAYKSVAPMQGRAYALASFAKVHFGAALSFPLGTTCSEY